MVQLPDRGLVCDGGNLENGADARKDLPAHGGANTLEQQREKHQLPKRARLEKVTEKMNESLRIKEESF